VQSWAGADIGDVVARAIEPFNASRFDVGGPRIHLTPGQALALSMALHELATNAAKYGALSTSAGGVAITWSRAGTLSFRWRERGGPPVSTPTRQGFGTRLLLQGLTRELGGRTRLDYAPEGVTCEITAQL